jgi:hypothetical protein
LSLVTSAATKEGVYSGPLACDCERFKGKEMNTNTASHTDFIFSITADWVLLLPVLVIGAAVVGFAIYKKFKK